MNRQLYLIAVATAAIVLIFFAGSAAFLFVGGHNITPRHEQYLTILLPVFIALIANPKPEQTRTTSDKDKNQ